MFGWMGRCVSEWVGGRMGGWVSGLVRMSYLIDVCDGGLDGWVYDCVSERRVL